MIEIKKLNKLIFVEIFLGIVFVVAGIYVCFWAAKTVWIMIYPPPKEKQIIEALPYLFWLIGVFLVGDGIRRLLGILYSKRGKEK